MKKSAHKDILIKYKIITIINPKQVVEMKTKQIKQNIKIKNYLTSDLVNDKNELNKN